MNLHKNKRFFRNLAQQLSDRLRIPAIYINLVYGKLPAAEAMLNTLKMISERLTTIKWTILPELTSEISRRKQNLIL